MGAVILVKNWRDRENGNSEVEKVPETVDGKAIPRFEELDRHRLAEFIAILADLDRAQARKERNVA